MRGANALLGLAAVGFLFLVVSTLYVLRQNNLQGQADANIIASLRRSNTILVENQVESCIRGNVIRAKLALPLVDCQKAVHRP